MAKNTFKNTFTIHHTILLFSFSSITSISPEHQDYLQNNFEPPENCFQIIQTEWTTNDTFGKPKIHSKTHSQYSIYILLFSFSSISSVSPEHQDHLQNYFKPPENCFQIIQTEWTTNNTFGQPKTHSKTHSQYSIYIPVFFLKFHF